MPPCSALDSCGEGGGAGGCDLPWCHTTPALTEIQFYFGYIIATVSFPFCIGICQAIFSKVSKCLITY